ncbi:copper amine oxidase N-terminal domain-containing protein [Tumebacillus flagellatus]|uniref:Copper amine oxidase-like N-terminal domain-containing protein n=1 Tax=Tumebacillus flagellatus TaxID=1157490 RepID=A0A074LRZ8_9BACL|nr:stalk domain-containing protein [Tumebacillus flagellatus]KEO83255.1 hypothetical protein EL26_11230 [Tumebacillus flagellatus]
MNRRLHTFAPLLTAALLTAVVPQTALADSTEPVVNWKMEFTDAAHPVTEPVVGADGTVYLGTSQNGPDVTEISAIKDGSLEWTYPTTAKHPLLVPSKVSSGLVLAGVDDQVLELNEKGQVVWTVNESPSQVRNLMEGADGTVYVSTYSGLQILKADGTVSGSLSYAPFHGEPTSWSVQDDGSVSLLFSGTNPTGETSYAHVGRDGNVLSQATVPMPENSSPVLDPNGLILNPHYQGQEVWVDLLNPDGSTVWSTKIDGAAGTVRAPKFDQAGHVVVVSGSMYQGGVLATYLEAKTGRITSSFSTIGVVLDTNFGFSPEDGTLYLPFNNAKSAIRGVHAIGADGKEKWFYPNGTSYPGAGSHGALAISGGQLLIFLQDVRPLTVVVNGKPVSFPDAQPFVNVDQRTLVPLRFVAEQLGAHLEWHEDTQSVDIDNAGLRIHLAIGASEATVNGERVTFDTSAVIRDDRTFVPLRFLAETMGLVVKWNEAANQVVLEAPAK